MADRRKKSRNRLSKFHVSRMTEQEHDLSRVIDDGPYYDFSDVRSMGEIRQQDLVYLLNKLHIKSATIALIENWF